MEAEQKKKLFWHCFGTAILGGATVYFRRGDGVRDSCQGGEVAYSGRNRDLPRTESARAAATETCTGDALTLVPGTPLGQGLGSSEKIPLARVGTVPEGYRPRPLGLLWSTGSVVVGAHLPGALEPCTDASTETRWKLLGGRCSEPSRNLLGSF